MRPLTPVRRRFFPVLHHDGRLEPDAGVWALPRPHRGQPGALLISRPGGWRSALQLARLLWTAVRR